jgi:hypothetical protein
MYLPLFFTTATASAKLIAFDATSAEYSPRLKPAVTSGTIPLSLRTSSMAILVVSIDGCVFSVFFKSSSLFLISRWQYQKSPLPAYSFLLFLFPYRYIVPLDQEKYMLF